jgi:hypothetical protein
MNRLTPVLPGVQLEYGMKLLRKEAPMRRLIAVSLLMALMLFTGGFSTLTHAQSPGIDLKPTFINPTPGLYVHGWPPFTVSYPKEWMEHVPGPFSVFRVGPPRPDLSSGKGFPGLTIGAAYANPLPLVDWAKVSMPYYVMFGSDIKVLSDAPSQLKDGTPAREIEIEYFLKNDPKVKLNEFMLITKKEWSWVWVVLIDDKGRIGEDLKKYAYSLTFLPGKDEPVKVPPDVRAFFDMWCADHTSHDVKAIMSHISDRFSHGGYGKAFTEQFFRNDPTSPANREYVSCEPTVTLFEPRGDRAYVDGFLVIKAKGDTNALKIPLAFQQIINEHGQWKWFGNQK